MAARSLVLEALGDTLAAVHAPDRLTRTGIDGVDGAGKTFLAEELAPAQVRDVRVPQHRSDRP